MMAAKGFIFAPLMAMFMLFQPVMTTLISASMPEMSDLRTCLGPVCMHGKPGWNPSFIPAKITYAASEIS